MKRSLDTLAAKEYDVIIIGGGIYGAWAAWDAALRGLSVALLEKEDFGSATSSNSLKIIHGGLRYLQHADFKRMRESINERKILMRVAPQFVHPLPCIMPTYGHGLKGKEVMAVALRLNDLVGFDRNSLPDPEKNLPNGKVISRAETLDLLPGIDSQNLTGGAIWYDCQVNNSERLLISVVRGAVEKGAEAANYAEVTDFLRSDNRIVGVKVKDRMDGRSFEIRGRTLLNTCGPWVGKMLGRLNGFQPSPKLPLSKAMNLVVRRQLIPKFGVGVPSKFEFKDADAVLNKGSRLLFFTPWRQYTLIGTTHVPYHDDVDDFAITEADIASFLDEFNQAYPALRVERDEISYWYGGLLPMDDVPANNGHVTLTKHYRFIDHEKENGLKGLVSVIGVKYTTARDVATKAIDLIAAKLNRKNATQTDSTPIPGGNIADFATYLQQETIKRPWGFDANIVRHLVTNYGTTYPSVLQHLQEDSNWKFRLEESQEILAVEVVHGIRDEMALRLSDVVMRRTELGSAGCPSEQSIAACAAIMATELGWDEQHKQAEIDRLKAIYVPRR